MSQKKIPAVFMRGGTSKALVFNRADLPDDQDQWASVFLAAMGSPDPYGRQLDGMGGGQSSLSKVCVISKSAREDADVDYTFAQVSVLGEAVDYSGNCGNMSSAVGPYAYEEGLVSGPANGECLVRIHNTNSGKIIHSTFRVSNGQACVRGEVTLTGLASKGSPVVLSFIDPANTLGRGLLTQARARHELQTLRGETVSVSLVDSAIPSVFVLAESLGLEGTIMPDQLETDQSSLAELEYIREQASVLMGIAETVEQARAIIAIPKLCIVSQPESYQALNGQQINAADVDLVVRMISAGQPHRAAPITVSLAVASAAAVAGTLVNEVAQGAPNLQRLRLGTPSGVIEVGAKIEACAHSAIPRIHAAEIVRTQRRLMEGLVCIPSTSDDNNG